jgi:NMD protein affecting ribosome stability and mRNA decay
MEEAKKGPSLIKEIRLICPKCGEHGNIKQFRREEGRLVMACTHKHEWISASGVCPACGEPNQYPADGMCKSCYEKLHDERSQAV